MKQFTVHLANRLDAEFQQIEIEHKDKLLMLLKKIEVATILVQELQVHVVKYKLIATEKEQIIYFRDCLPLIKKWQIAFEFIYHIEKLEILGTSEMKVAYYKQALCKLNSSYKQKQNEFALLRQKDKQFESITLISSCLNNDIVALHEAFFIAEKYLIEIIAQVKNDSLFFKQSSTVNLKWCKSKTDLVELCYALFYGTCLTDVTTQKPAQLTKISAALEFAFGAELKDYNRLFSDVKNRKINDSFTKYLQQIIQHQIEIHFK